MDKKPERKTKKQITPQNQNKKNIKETNNPKQQQKTPNLLNNYLPEVAQEVDNQVWNWGFKYKLSCAAIMSIPCLLL